MPRRNRAVFRIPVAALFLPLLLVIAVTPLASYRATDTAPYHPALLALYLIPVLALVYLLFTRTVADADKIITVGPTGVHRIPWPELDGFEFRGSRWAVAVTVTGARRRLPMVRPRDLPRLAAVSGGWLNLGTITEPVAAGADTDPAPAPDTDTAVESTPADGTEIHPAGGEPVGDAEAHRGPTTGVLPPPGTAGQAARTLADRG